MYAIYLRGKVYVHLCTVQIGVRLSTWYGSTTIVVKARHNHPPQTALHSLATTCNLPEAPLIIRSYLWMIILKKKARRVVDHGTKPKVETGPGTRLPIEPVISLLALNRIPTC